jgi:hypothetical protein
MIKNVIKNDATASTAKAERAKVLAGPWSTPPWTMDERLHRIDVLGQKIAEYVRFLGEAVGQTNASAEAKDRVVTAFYDRIVVVERQLSRIQENFRLE